MNWKWNPRAFLLLWYFTFWLYRNYIWKYNHVLFGKHRENCLFFTLTINLKLQTNTLKLSKPAIFNKITKFYSHHHPLTHLHHRSPICARYSRLSCHWWLRSCHRGWCHQWGGLYQTHVSTLALAHFVFGSVLLHALGFKRCLGP